MLMLMILLGGDGVSAVCSSCVCHSSDDGSGESSSGGGAVFVVGGEVGGVVVGIFRMDFSCRDFGLSPLLSGVAIFSMDWRRVCWVRSTVGGAVFLS